MSIAAHLEVERKRFPNGLRLVCSPLTHLQSATVAVYIRSGSRYETPTLNGISHVLEHMVYRGTSAYPSAYELNSAIEKLGGTLDASTSVDLTEYQITLPHENLLEAIELIAEVVTKPIFSNLDIEKKIIKEEILEDLNEQRVQTDPDNIARRIMFGDHPLGFPIAGTVDSLEKIDIDDLKRQLAQRHVGNNMVVSLAGNFETHAAQRTTEQCFASLTSGTQSTPLAAPSDLPTQSFMSVHDPGSQTQVRLSFPTIGVHHADTMATLLLSRVIDDGLSTRLYRRICDEKGLAYEAFASFDPYEDCGVFDFGTAVEHSKTEIVVGALIELVKELRDKGIQKSELEVARNRYLWCLRAAFDSSEEIASLYGTNEIFDLHEGLAELEAQAKALSHRDLERVANEQLEFNKASLCCVGVLDEKMKAQIQEVLQAAS